LAGPIEKITGQYMMYGIDTCAGQSGSGVWMKGLNNYYVGGSSRFGR